MIGGPNAHAACAILQSDNSPASQKQDHLYQLLQAAEPCPRNVFDLRRLIKDQGGILQTAMVANQGFHNPDSGNFSLFEMAQGSIGGLVPPVEFGEFFFGHFTAGIQDTLVANQTPQGLMVELIVWDPKTEMFNFYELIGNGERGTWFYRGNSEDILLDNELLHRQSDPLNPQFGSRLRCSGCHMSGGPIMKELTPPHNDWWTQERKLPLGNWKLGPNLQKIFPDLIDATVFAQGVKKGIRLLEESESFQERKSRRSLQEQLRPLFCPVEVNLESDGPSFWRGRIDIRVPSAFFVDKHLATGTLIMGQKEYFSALSHFNSDFPGGGADADHAWLTPVKGYSDGQAINTLAQKQIVDFEFIADVLAVDFRRPIFSKKRCILLKLVPNELTPQWRSVFLENLKKAAQESEDFDLKNGSQELVENLTESHKTALSHRIAANSFLGQCGLNLEEQENRIQLVKYLTQKRQEVSASEISKNPRGQIFEPDGFNGFKRLFPTVTGAPEPWTFVLNAKCEIERDRL
ncbi:MAG: hypothetical protein NPIRA03_37770 [Nitrospirales bacterium]|nr:MAG: hypothetical protein NPIRA03_37770 [Nitrospirales bacterium]